jgi:hypothetical protein
MLIGLHTSNHDFHIFSYIFVYIKGHQYPHGFRPNNSASTVGMESLCTGLASASVGFCILVLVISSWCLIFGTELAFRGEDEGSMTRAVDGLYAERKWAIRFFMCALASTLMSGIAYLALIIEFQELAAVPICCLFVLGCIAAYYMRMWVRPRFRFPEGLRKNDGTDLYFDGGFDPEIRRNVEVREQNRV